MPSDDLPEAGDQSLRRRPGAIQFVSLQADSEDAPAGEPNEEPAPDAAEMEPESPAADTPEPPAETPEAPAETPESPAETPEAPESPEMPETPEVPETPAEEPEPPVEGDPVPEPPTRQPEPTGEPPAERERPSEAVKDRIRRKLAHERVDAIFAELERSLMRYRNAVILYERDVETNPSLTPPARPDFEALAREHGLIAAKTGLISQWEANQLDIGRSMVDWENIFLRYAFERLPELRPATSFDLSGNRYLFWKTEDRGERVPAFAEPGVRDRVLRTWKMVEARKPALAEAEKLAEAARKQASLRDVLADRPTVRVVETEPFSWMTTGAVPQLMSDAPPRISQVSGVDRPGDEFMRAVFRLRAGDVGVAMNQPKTEAYVVRLIEYAPSDELLWARFESERPDQYMGVAVEEQREIVLAWIEGLRQTYGLKWEERPQQPAAEEE